MTVILPYRLVVTSSPPRVYCAVAVVQDVLQSITVNLMACNPSVIRTGISQGADKDYQIVDGSDEGFSGAAEIEFKVWERNDGALLLSKTLTSGDITIVAPNRCTFSVSNDISTDMTKGNKRCEIWVTSSSGLRRQSGIGTFRVTDTRNFD